MDANQCLKAEQKLVLDIARNVFNGDYAIDGKLLNNINWDYLFQLSNKHAIFPIVFKIVEKKMPQEIRVKYFANYHQLKLKTKQRIQETRCILKEAFEKNVKAILVKGFILSHIIYNDTGIRQFGDVDIIVPEDQILQMCHMMEGMGYFDERLTNDVQKPLLDRGAIDEFYKIGYESKFVNPKVGRNLIEVKKAGGIEYNILEEYLKHTVAMNIDDFSYITFDTLHTFLFLVINTYKNFEGVNFGIENCSQIRDIIDVYGFIRKYGDIIDWNEVYEFSKEYKIIEKVHYVLSLVNSIYIDFIPNEMIKRFMICLDKYECDVNGDKIGWHTDIIFRLFNSEKRINEKHDSVKRTIFSDSFFNSTLPVIVPRMPINADIAVFPLIFNMNFLKVYFKTFNSNVCFNLLLSSKHWQFFSNTNFSVIMYVQTRSHLFHDPIYMGSPAPSGHPFSGGNNPMFRRYSRRQDYTRGCLPI